MAKRGRPVGSKNKKGGYFHTTSKPMGVIKRKSTRATVIAHLEKFGYITKKSAEDLYNVNNFYQVISNLRGDGFHIELKRGVGGIAEYHLLRKEDLFQDATVALDVDKTPQRITKKNYTGIVLNHMKEHGYIGRKEAIEKYGIANISQVIAYLKSLGYKISYRKDICAQREYYLVEDSVTLKTNDTCGIEEAMTCFTNWDEAIKEMEKKNTEKKVEKSIAKEPEIPAEDMKVKTSMKEVILDHLKKHKTITSVVAMKKYRCLNLCTIIGTLRDEGYNISRSRERKSSDYNTASNRNNSYVVYTLEDKARKTKAYTINCVCEGAVSMLMEPFAPSYKTIGDAINTAVNKATKLAEYCNAFYGTSTVDFIVNNSTDGVWLRKRETIKKLFRKEYNLTTLAHFTFGEIEVDI